MNTVFHAHNVDRLADSVLSALRTTSNTHYLPLDVYRTDEHVVLHADIPGVDPGSIDVGVENSVLTIRAERTPRALEGAEWVARERATGTVVRAISLGDGIDTGRITATYDNGVLTLTMPIAAKALARKIAIQSPAESPSVAIGEAAATPSELMPIAPEKVRDMSDTTLRTGLADPDDWVFWELILNDQELLTLEVPQDPTRADSR